MKFHTIMILVLSIGVSGCHDLLVDEPVEVDIGSSPLDGAFSGKCIVLSDSACFWMKLNDETSVRLFDHGLTNPQGMALSHGADKILVAERDKILEFDLEGTLLRQVAVNLHIARSEFGDVNPNGQTFGYCGNDETIWWIEQPTFYNFVLKTDGPEVVLPEFNLPSTDPTREYPMDRIAIRAADMSVNNDLIVQWSYYAIVGSQGSTYWTSALFTVGNEPNFEATVANESVNLRWVGNGSSYFGYFDASISFDDSHTWTEVNNGFKKVYGSDEVFGIGFTGPKVGQVGEQLIDDDFRDEWTFAFRFRTTTEIGEDLVSLTIQMDSPARNIIDYDWR